MIHRKIKRPFLLLEVIIAFTLVILCIIPLIAPHTFIATQQRKFIHQIELDHFINLFCADIVEKLYRGQIDWNTLVGGSKNSIDDPRLETILNPIGGKYAASYWFEEIAHKPTDEAPRNFYVFRLHLLFEPQNAEKTAAKTEKNITSHYDVFVVRENAEEQSRAPQT